MENDSSLQDFIVMKIALVIVWFWSRRKKEGTHSYKQVLDMSTIYIYT
jgi:hypothetical protein